MKQGKYIRQIIFIIIPLFISGCDKYFQPYLPTSVDIVPIKISAQFFVENKTANSLQQQFDQYFERHQQSLLNEPLTVTWSGEAGKNLAAYSREKLTDLRHSRRLIGLRPLRAFIAPKGAYQSKSC